MLRRWLYQRHVERGCAFCFGKPSEIPHSTSSGSVSAFLSQNGGSSYTDFTKGFCHFFTFILQLLLVIRN